MKILAIGAHFDDIELNCLGTLLKAKASGFKVYLIVCTFGTSMGAANETQLEQDKINKIIGYDGYWQLGFADGSLTHHPSVVSNLDKIIKEVKPGYIITHNDKDYHQDHIGVAKSVKSANRSYSASLITFPSQDFKMPFDANLYVDISEYYNKKLRILKKYKTQMNRLWFSKDIIKAKNSGMGIAKYVEKFHIEFLRL